MTGEHSWDATPGPPGRAADRLLLQVTRRSGRLAMLLTLTALAGAAAETALPAVLGRAVDAVLGTGRAGRSSPPGDADWARWLACLTVMTALIACCDAFGQFATGAVAATGTSWLRRVMIGHILSVGSRLADRFAAGDIVGRLVGGAADAGTAPGSLALAAAALLPPLGAVAALLLIDARLAVTVAAGLPLLALMLGRFLRDTSAVVGRYQCAQGEIAALLLDALGGVRTIAAAGTCEAEIARVLLPLPTLRSWGERTWRVQARVAAQGTLLIPLLQVLVLAVGGLELAARRIGPGELLAASQYAVLATGAGAAIAHFGRLARARAGARRAAELLAVPPPRHGKRHLPPGTGCIEFRRVTVRAADTTVIDGLDLTLPGRIAVAIVGQSGAGKSTLAAIAGRLTDPDQGEVLLDGIPLTKLDLRELRRAFGYAFDRPHLLGHSFGSVIRFGDPPASWHRMLHAARAAGADAFIRRLPEGYHTMLAQVPVSGGQAQRLGLARAFARTEARVLILDDATSNLDTATEAQVSRALTGEFRDRTRLIVAHRASTAARADLVVWLDHGRVRACATHGELWADPDYRAIFEPSVGPGNRGPGGPGSGVASARARLAGAPENGTGAAAGPAASAGGASPWRAPPTGGTQPAPAGETQPAPAARRPPPS